MAWRFRGTVLIEGIETGDHRLIDPGATRWRTLPLDCRAVFEDGWGGHEGATPVGVIEVIERQDANVVVDGPLLIGDDCADRWANLNIQGALRGVSVDLTGGTAVGEIVNIQTGEVLPAEIGIEVLYGPQGDDYYYRERWTDAEIGAITCVGTPAFADCTIEVYDDASVPSLNVPTGTAPTTDSGGATATASAASIDIIDPSLEAQTPTTGREVGRFADTTDPDAIVDGIDVGDQVSWVDAKGVTQTGTVTAVDPDAGTVEVQPDDGTSVVTVNAKELTITAEEPDESDSDSAEMPPADGSASSRFPAMAARLTPRPALATLLARERGDVVTASAATLERGAHVQPAIVWDEGPPRDAFERRADGPTPWTIEDDGTIYGHLCLWGQCHTGFAGATLQRCLMPEQSPSNYSLFHASGEVRCDDGSRVPVGIVSMDTGHAPSGMPGRRPSARVVTGHYDNTGLQAMQIRVRDDEFGAWGCGVLAPGISVDAVRRAMAAKPSGDWRNYGDGLDLLGVLMVNVPGYPQFRVDDGQVTMLTASLSPPANFTARPPVAHEGHALATALAFPAGTALDEVQRQVAALAAHDCGCGGTCGSCGTAKGAALAAQREPIRWPTLRLRAADEVMA